MMPAGIGFAIEARGGSHVFFEDAKEIGIVVEATSLDDFVNRA